MPPPSSGGIAVAATLGILEHFAMAGHKPTDMDLNGGRPAVMGVHLIAEAERLAYADRDKYVADTDFVPLPGNSPKTLDQQRLPRGPGRADLRAAHDGHGEARRIRPTDHTDAAHAGARHQPDQHRRLAGQCGSTDHHRRIRLRLVPHGGRLHSEQPTDRLLRRTRQPRRRPVANRIQPGKRPRSTMAPTLVFDQPVPGQAGDRGPLYAVLGSPAEQSSSSS